MLALKINSNKSAGHRFTHLFSSTSDKFDLDLTSSTLVQVLREREAFVRKTSPKYTNQSVISLIRGIEQMSGADEPLMPFQVNGVFYNEVYEYLVDEKHLQPDTAKNYFQKISSSLKWAASYGARINPGFNDFKIKIDEKQKYALSIEEVLMIYDFDLRKLTKKVKKAVTEKRTEIVECHRKGNTYYRKIVKSEKHKVDAYVPLFRENHLQVLERVKDMFVLSCMLYQRYSDMKTLCPDNFSEHNTVVKFTQQKTGGKAVVKINEVCASKEVTYAILEKYGYYAPYGENINTYNKHLHELLNVIGGHFNDEFVTECKLFGEIRKVAKKLSKAISSHTARRTAITLATKTHNEFKIRQASGHKDGRSFARYICYND